MADNIEDVRVLSEQEIEEVLTRTNLLKFKMEGIDIPIHKGPLSHFEYAEFLANLESKYEGTFMAPVFAKISDLHYRIAKEYPQKMVENPYEIVLSTCGQCGCHSNLRCFTAQLGGCFICFP